MQNLWKIVTVVAVMGAGGFAAFQAINNRDSKARTGEELAQLPLDKFRSDEAPPFQGQPASKNAPSELSSAPPRENPFDTPPAFPTPTPTAARPTPASLSDSQEDPFATGKPVVPQTKQQPDAETTDPFAQPANNTPSVSEKYDRNRPERAYEPSEPDPLADAPTPVEPVTRRLASEPAPSTPLPLEPLPVRSGDVPEMRRENDPRENRPLENDPLGNSAPPDLSAPAPSLRPAPDAAQNQPSMESPAGRDLPTEPDPFDKPPTRDTELSPSRPQIPPTGDRSPGGTNNDSIWSNIRPRNDERSRQFRTNEDPSADPSVITPVLGQPEAFPSATPQPQPMEDPLPNRPLEMEIAPPRRLPSETGRPDPLDATPPRSRPLMRDEPIEPMSFSREPANASRELGDTRGDGVADPKTPRGRLQPRLSIEKIAPAQATLGQSLTYTVVIKNTGGSDAHHVIVEDRIPRGTRLTGTAPQAEMVEKRLIWRLGTLPPGEEKKISIRVVPEEEGPIGSVARVNFVAEVAAEIMVTAPQLALTLESQKQAYVGDVIPVTFRVRNTGTGDANNVILRDILPEGLQHPAGKDVEYAIGKLLTGESREIRLELSAAAAGLARNKAVLTADGGFTKEQSHTVDILGEQLLLSRSGPQKSLVGQKSTYTNLVANEGDRPVTKATLTDAVPQGFDFVEASDGGQYDPATRTVSWVLPTMKGRGQTSVKLTMLARAVGDHQGDLLLTAPDGSQARLRPALPVVGSASVQIVSLSDARPVNVGEQVISKIQLRNGGTASANNVEFSVEVPPSLRLISAKGPLRYRVVQNTIVFEPQREIQVGDTLSYEMTFEAAQAGDARLGLQLTADHLQRPVRKDETLQIARGNSGR